MEEIGEVRAIGALERHDRRVENTVFQQTSPQPCNNAASQDDEHSGEE